MSSSHKNTKSETTTFVDSPVMRPVLMKSLKYYFKAQLSSLSNKRFTVTPRHTQRIVPTSWPTQFDALGRLRLKRRRTR